MKQVCQKEHEKTSSRLFRVFLEVQICDARGECPFAARYRHQSSCLSNTLLYPKNECVYLLSTWCYLTRTQLISRATSDDIFFQRLRVITEIFSRFMISRLSNRSVMFLIIRSDNIWLTFRLICWCCHSCVALTVLPICDNIRKRLSKWRL